MSLPLDIHKISKSRWLIQQRKAKQKEYNQTRFIRVSLLFTASNKKNQDQPTRRPVPYRFLFKLQMGIQISAWVLIEFWYWHLLPNLISETQIFSVSVSVPSLRLRFFSLGLVIETHILLFSVSSLRIEHFSLGLGLVIDTQTFSVLVSVSLLRLRHFQSHFWGCLHSYSILVF